MATVSGTTTSETVCLQHGFHQHVHTAVDSHSVSVLGYNESMVTHAGAGGTTDFVVGDCTDVDVLIETTTQSSGPVTWTITSGPNSKSWLPCLSRVNREATHFNYWTVCVCFHCDYAGPTWTFSSGGTIGTDEPRPSCMFDND